MTKIAGSGSGSVSQRRGFADPDLDVSVELHGFFLNCYSLLIDGSGSGYRARCGFVCITLSSPDCADPDCSDPVCPDPDCAFPDCSDLY
jgi:hypothetical protein